MHVPFSYDAVEFHMFADSVKFVKDCKGQNDSRCQAAKVESGFDFFIILL